MRRDSLHAALAGRDEKSLEIIMRFIAKYVPPIYLNIAAFSDKNHLNARNLFAVMAGVLIAWIRRFYSLSGVADHLASPSVSDVLVSTHSSVFSFRNITDARFTSAMMDLIHTLVGENYSLAVNMSCPTMGALRFISQRSTCQCCSHRVIPLGILEFRDNSIVTAVFSVMQLGADWQTTVSSSQW